MVIKQKMLKSTEQIAFGNGKCCFEIEEIECFCPGDHLPFPPKLDRVSQNISSLMCCVLGGTELCVLGRLRRNSRSKENSWNPDKVPQWDQSLQLGSRAGLGLILMPPSPILAAQECPEEAGAGRGRQSCSGMSSGQPVLLHSGTNPAQSLPRL